MSKSKIRIEITAPLSSLDIDELQKDLKSLARVEQPQDESFEFGTVVLVVSLIAGGIQTADILAKWLKNINPSRNKIVLRLSNGKTLSMESNNNPDDFLKQVKSALRDF